MNDFGLDADEMATIRSIFAAYSEIETAVLYGSRATGRFRPGSDVDLVLTGKHLTDRTILDVRAAFGDSNLPYFFDIVADKEIRDENLKKEIHATKRLLYVLEKTARSTG